MTSADPLAAGGLSRRARIALPIVLLLLVIASAYRYAQRPDRPFTEWSGASMGTTWSVKVAGDDLGMPREQELRDVIAARLERVDALMSTWKPESELSRFNRHPAGRPFPLAPETLRVFQIAHEVSEQSGGAFDVTVAPLVDAWGFGATGRTKGPPSDEALAEARGRVGFRMLRIDTAAGAISKQRDGVSADLSAVAKGFAVDEVARALRERGQRDFLVEVGGELRASGAHRDGSPWRVAVEEPGASSRKVHRVVPLSDRAMATSGDYRNYYEDEAGRRVSHTIDPRTGRPITHGLASVTVVSAEAALADAWATALNVLGPDEGYLLAQERGLVAHFILRDGGGFATRTTRGFADLLGSPAELLGSPNGSR